jgi:hypothetical protein
LKDTSEKGRVAGHYKFPEKPDPECMAACMESLMKEMQRISGKPEGSQKTEFANLVFRDRPHALFLNQFSQINLFQTKKLTAVIATASFFINNFNALLFFACE